MKIGDIYIKWLGHSGFQILYNDKVIYIDPYNIQEGLEKADYIFITHSHYDHCSVADIEKILKQGTNIISPVDCQSKWSKFTIPIKTEIIEPWKEIDFNEIQVSAIPAYNENKSFHPKDESWVGYVIKINGVIIYHAGDTDKINEMQKLTGYKQDNKKFIALLPIGGRFTMSSEEAVDAVKLIKPNIAIPMHYGSIIGSNEDAQDFIEQCKELNINAFILNKNE